MSKHKHHRKHTLEEMEQLYSSLEPPIIPISDQSKHHAEGYKFYQRVRERLPEYWEEFNGTLDKHGRLKYTTIRVFIKSKTSKASESKWLLAMIGPARSAMNAVPWLGDWERRRRNGYGLLDAPDKIKPLLKVIKENLAAADSIKATAPFLLEELAQYSALQKQVHEAFAGQAFLSGKSANHKENVSRFDCYKQMLSALTGLKVRVIREIMRVYGVDPDAPQQMRDMVQMAGGIGAAAALTGIAAGQHIPGYGQTINTPQGTQVAPYTYDAIKLAEHLTRHAHTFRKPLPPTIEADPSSYEDEDSSDSSHKGNGKVV